MDRFFSHISQDLYDYWRALSQRCGGIPQRDDLDPAEIPSLLPFVFIVEKLPEGGRYRFRLSGTAIREIMGWENTGRHLDELLEGEDLRYVTAMFDQVLSQRVCLRSVEGLTYADQTRMRVEILRMPFADKTGACRFLVGCLSCVERGCGDGRNAASCMIFGQQVVRIENDLVPREVF